MSDQGIAHDYVFNLPSGTEIDIAGARGDLGRACEYLSLLRSGELKDREWQEIDEVLCDLPHVSELLVLLAERVVARGTNGLRVWHIPQVPGKPFTVEVGSIADAVKIRNVLAEYDAFQLEQNIKPNYSNVSGIERWNERDREWEEVDEDEILEEGESNGLVVNE